jgi:hypothetical protein
LQGSTKFGDFQIDKYVLHYSRMLAMPLLYIHKSSGEQNNALLWFKESDKTASADWPEIENFLHSGYSIVTFDFRGLGETRMPYTSSRPMIPCWENWILTMPMETRSPACWRIMFTIHFYPGAPTFFK